MRFSFDESEIMNNYLEQQSTTPTKEDFIKDLRITIVNTEDMDLVEICNDIVMKLLELTKENYIKLVSELPIETMSNY